MNNQMPYYIRMFLALAYIVLGIVVLSSDFYQIGKKYSMLFGALLIGYGIFRAYRNQKKWDVLKHERDSSLRDRYLDNWA